MASDPVERAARAVAAIDSPWLDWGQAADTYRERCRAIARAVIDTLMPSDLAMPAGVSDEEDW